MNSPKFALCFSSFDERVGPLAVWEYGLTKEEAQSVAFSSHLTLVMTQLTSENDNFSLDAILPFPKLQMTGYTYLFSVDAPEARRKEPAISSITLLVPSRDQSFLFFQAPKIREKVIPVAGNIKKTWVYKKNNPLSSDLINDILQWANGFQDSSENVLTEKSRVENLQKPHLDTTEMFGNLINEYGDQVTTIMTALFTGKPIIVAGEEIKVNLTINNIEVYSTFRSLRIKYWSDIPVSKLANIDLIGISEAAAKLFTPSDDLIIINAEKKSIKGGKQDTVIKNIVKNLKKKSAYEIQTYITEEANKILTISNEIISTIQNNNEAGIKEELKKIERKYSYPMLRFCNEVITITNPNIAAVVSKYIQGVSGWLDSFGM